MSEPRVALITGASGGLGRVLAAELAAEGWHLALLGSDQGRLESLRADLGLADDRSMVGAANLRDAGATAAAIDAVDERFGRADALAHLVGGWTGGERIDGIADEPFASMIDQHLWTTLNVVRAVAPRMVAAGRGRIVAVSSPLARRPAPGMSAYAAGKAAMEALMGTLATELRGSGVTANVVRVRTIDTRHERDASPSDSNASWTTPEEVSAAIRYLFSDEARVVNGEQIGLHSGR